MRLRRGWRRRPRSPGALGVVASYDQERRGVSVPMARQGDQLRGGLSHQPIELHVQLWRSPRRGPHNDGPPNAVRTWSLLPR